MATILRPDRRRLAPDLEVSRVVTGLWQLADMERGGRQLDLDGVARAMGLYVEAGFTTFDMADHYGSAEEIAGRFVSAGGRAELLTKWVPEPGPIGRDMVRTAVQRALGRLKRERIELLQFHAWRFSDPSWLDALFFLDELRAEGLITSAPSTSILRTCGWPSPAGSVWSRTRSSSRCSIGARQGR